MTRLAWWRQVGKLLLGAATGRAANALACLLTLASMIHPARPMPPLNGVLFAVVAAGCASNLLRLRVERLEAHEWRRLSELYPAREQDG